MLRASLLNFKGKLHTKNGLAENGIPFSAKLFFKEKCQNAHLLLIVDCVFCFPYSLYFAISAIFLGISVLSMRPVNSSQTILQSHGVYR